MLYVPAGELGVAGVANTSVPPRLAGVSLIETTPFQVATLLLPLIRPE